MDNKTVEEVPAVYTGRTPPNEAQKKQGRLKALIKWAGKGITFSTIGRPVRERRTSSPPQAPVWARDVQKRQKAARRIMRAHQP